MTIEERKEKFVSLGKFLGQFTAEGIFEKENIPHNDQFFARMKDTIEAAVHHNGWFTRENVLFSLDQWSRALTSENLDQWLKPYGLSEVQPKTVGLIMAGNIPLVGFHDFLSVLISGHKVLVKQSSNDKLLLPVIADYLIALAPEWKEKIQFLSDSSEGASKMKDYDAVIATGSNNTARYFEYYFAGKPSIIRKNRSSVAVLTGEESAEELAALGEDIFRYYGLGCRNVSKLYVPENYDFDAFFKAMYSWNPIINQAKYANNYDYNKAVYLMSQFKLLENGFLILKEDKSFGSPIATLFYETYSDKEELKKELEARKENIQCVVSQELFENEVDFGKTQQPNLWDYADNVDTLQFLTKKI
ncbi:Acyl-CoA reductase (LuxC) [Salinimicrobium catena]|uniref:Acyl-CoA reductase (LuxC) n=1 Tax=Salinimicrobium catena TaxID=390640 RepID=A0A1H5LUS4_9FLAO|nr:acyl-CoA reductase [Salinimicrobium catena]SDL14720.1 Acyl-CoA reductase (LuxC) [Salinimicrobium catena]SEE80769.1 Acyl-CoA reductase (LuxC) [Salinimicrobium catena]